MRKVALTSLFLILFNVSGQNSPYASAESISDNVEKINNDKIIKRIDYSINENRGCGLVWSENMPLFCPIRIDSITSISDLFGMRQNHPVLHIPKFHHGIDFSARFKTPIHCTANGVVEKIQHKRYGYGNNIIINHGDGYKTRYAHLNEIFVNEGDTIKLDDIIGNVGSTGMSTGNHLHYEIIFNDKPIDPLSFYFNSTTENKNGADYVKILTDLEKIKNQLLNNNDSFWDQAVVLSQIQNKT